MQIPRAMLAPVVALGMAGAPATVNALDVGGAVSKTTRSVSKTTRSTTRSVSRSVGSTTSGATSTAGGAVSSATGSLTGNTGGSYGGGGSSSGGNAGTVGVLSNFQLMSLGLQENPPTTGGAGNTVSPEYVRALVAGLDRSEREELEIKCGNVLRSPMAFDSELTLLCQILASI